MSSSIDQARTDDIREWDFHQRQALNIGPGIRVFCGDNFVIELPHRMLAAVSTLPALHGPSNVVTELRLPANMGPQFVNDIAVWLFKYCNADIKMKSLETPRSIWGDLSILRAGRLLGMDKYTLHIHRYHWYRLRNKPLTAEEAQDVVDLAASAKDIYLCLMAEQMADNLRQGKVANPENMKAFINKSFFLRVAVENALVILEEQDKKWEEYQRKEAEEERKREERRRKDENRVKRKANGEWQGEGKEKQGKKHPTWADRNKRDAEVSKSLMEKIKNGKKAVLTREEARYYEKTRGRRCPYAVAH